MNSYIFSGKVLPERANVNITPIEVKIDAIDAGISGTAIISINVSQVSVVFNTNSNSDLMTLKNYVDYSVRTLIDAFGYLSGRGYDIEITSVVNHEGKHAVFGVGIPELEKSQKERPLSFQQLLEAMAKSQHLHRALSDLREAIRSPVDTQDSFVIERLRALDKTLKMIMITMLKAGKTCGNHFLSIEVGLIKSRNLLIRHVMERHHTYLEKIAY